MRGQNKNNPRKATSHGSANKKLTVSVLLTNYNHSKYLPDSLGGICSQSRRADEIIVVDDGSTDDSLKIIRNFQKKYKNITVLVNKKNRGALYSIDRALKAARQDFIVWASADDRLLPDFLKENMAALEANPQAHISFSQLATFQDGSRQITSFSPQKDGLAFDFGRRPHFLGPEAMLERLNKSYLWLSSNTAVVRRDTLLEMGGFIPELRWHADWLALYAVALRHGTYVVPNTLAAMRVLPQTYSSAGMKDERKQLKVLQEIADALSRPELADLRVKFRQRPCLFSPFGFQMLPALRRRWRDLDLYLRYLTWYNSHVGNTMIAQAKGTSPDGWLKYFRGLSRIVVYRFLRIITPRNWL